MTLLELNNICLQQGDFTLQVPYLRLKEGSLYALKGENGAGKSTLLRLLALLQEPRHGELLFSSQSVCWHGSRLKKIRQQITLLDQTPLLFCGTVEKNLAFGLKLRGLSGKGLQQRIDQALEIVGLSGFQQRSVKELSGGEARRVGLARALCLQPRLLLLDEPTANLDAGQVAALERFLVGLSQQGMTVVIATHDAQQPQRLGGEVITLANGQLQQIEQRRRSEDYQPLLKQVAGK